MAENRTSIRLTASAPSISPGGEITLTVHVQRNTALRYPTVVIWGAAAESGTFEIDNAQYTSDRIAPVGTDRMEAVTIDERKRGELRVKFHRSARETQDTSATFTADLYTLKRQPATQEEYLLELAAAAEGAENLRGRLASAELALDVVQPEPRELPTTVQPVTVQLTRTGSPPTDDQALWSIIRLTTQSLSFPRYEQFIDQVFCLPGPGGAQRSQVNALARTRALPFPDTEPYFLLKVATEVFMQVNCGVFFDENSFTRELSRTDPVFTEENLRLGRALARGELERAFARYVGENEILPYLDLVRQNLRDWSVSHRSLARGIPEDPEFIRVCTMILREKLTNPCLVELIWSYWHEEGMLVQTMKAIGVRFQNRQSGDGPTDPLALVEIDPLRPLNNFLWGHVQDEDHRLTVPRRAYEYDHHYGLTLLGKAVPRVRGADTRSRFIEAFHNLLYLCGIFFKQDDDTTVVSDGFPILNALREVHLLLTQGAHNQYLDLPWTARQEMLMEEWILSRPEFREFLPYRVMVDYPESWMHSVEAMKALQGWNTADILHYRDLGITGERILLSVRFGSWTAEQFGEAAKNWARYFRTEIQRYVHAYRAVTGVDLMDHPDATMPGVLLRQRLTRRPGTRVTEVPAQASALAPGRAPRPLSPPTTQAAVRETAEWSELEVQ